MPEITETEWSNFIATHPDAHILQTPEWGKLKSVFGWNTAFVRQGGAGAMVLFRRLPLGFSIGYIPKGPIGENWQELWPDIDRLCRKKCAVFLKVEPDFWEDEDPSHLGQIPGFITGAAPIQPRQTVIVDLAGSPEDWLGRMKQKTRYNIHLSERKGVVVHPSKDLAVFHSMMLVTGSRDGFGVHSLDYYRRAYELFCHLGQCELFIAEFEGQPLAGLMAFARGKRAWYFYGASTDAERSRMPTYLIQWEAMKWAAQKGCQEYDLWGIPDVEESQLESDFANRGDGLWGVYRFKRGFGGRVRRSASSEEKIYHPVLYRIYRQILARRGGEAG